jgi:hypothetical protein
MTAMAQISNFVLSTERSEPGGAVAVSKPATAKAGSSFSNVLRGQIVQADSQVADTRTKPAPKPTCKKRESFAADKANDNGNARQPSLQRGMPTVMSPIEPVGCVPVAQSMPDALMERKFAQGNRLAETHSADDGSQAEQSMQSELQSSDVVAGFTDKAGANPLQKTMLEQNPIFQSEAAAGPGQTADAVDLAQTDSWIAVTPSARQQTLADTTVVPEMKNLAVDGAAGEGSAKKPGLDMTDGNPSEVSQEVNSSILLSGKVALAQLIQEHRLNVMSGLTTIRTDAHSPSTSLDVKMDPNTNTSFAEDSVAGNQGGAPGSDSGAADGGFSRDSALFEREAVWANKSGSAARDSNSSFVVPLAPPEPQSAVPSHEEIPSAGPGHESGQTRDTSENCDPAKVFTANELAAAASHDELRVTLQTEKFGNVELHAHIAGDELGAAITVERKDAHSLLVAELPALQHALSEKQLRIDNLSLLQGSTTSNPENEKQSEQQNHRDGMSTAQKSRLALCSPENISNTNLNAVALSSGIFDLRGRLSVHA